METIPLAFPVPDSMMICMNGFLLVSYDIPEVNHTLWQHVLFFPGIQVEGKIALGEYFI